MKFAIVLLAVFGLSYAAPSTRSLKGDLDDFLALIPKNELVALYHKYENDADVKKIVAYLKSSDFAEVVHIVAQVDEVRDLVNYLETQGVPVIEFLNKLADRLGLPHWTRYTPYTLRESRSWRDFLDEAKKLVDTDKVVALVIDKLANSASFQELYEKIASVDYQKLHDNALQHPKIVEMIERLSNMGVDVKKVWEFVQSFFGWNYAAYGFKATRVSRSLASDLDDFLALIPKEDFIALYHKYENDADIKKIVAYLKSADFAKVVDIVKNVAEIRDLVNYVESQGVPVIEFLNKLADKLGLSHWSRYTPYTLRASRSWRDFIEEAKKLVDTNKVIALVIDKLANSVEVQTLYEKVASVDYQKLHDNALAHPEIADLVQRLNDMGVDVKSAWELVKSFFGWQ